MSFDIETYWAKDYTLRKLTPPEYILDPRFKLHICAVNLNGKTAVLEEPDFRELLKRVDPAETVTFSYNSLFDNCILAYRYGWVPRQMVDVLGLARTLLHHKLHRFGLAEVARELALPAKGNTILKTQGKTLAEIKADPTLWREYRAYCLNDMQLCGRIAVRLLPQMPPEELQLMDLVLRCAVQPVFHADRKLLSGYLADLRKIKKELLEEAGFEKVELMSTAKFKAVLEGLGVAVQTKKSKATGKDIPAFAKTDQFMEDLKNHDDYRVQAVAAARLSERSTIDETRAERFLSISSLPWKNGGGMLPVPLRYGGAHTHRLAGEWRINLQNLPRDVSKSKLRHALIAPSGYQVIAADLNQIEARLVAWTADCTQLLQQFREKKDPYAILASAIFGFEVNKNDHPVERFVGKTGILGLGYQCGAERFAMMVNGQARQYGFDLSGKFNLTVAMRTVDTYRTTYHQVPTLWRELDARLPTLNVGPEEAVLGPRVWNQAQHKWVNKFGLITIRKGEIELPNKMKLYYDVPDDKLYGGRLLENIIQALARIVVMQAAVRLAKRGYRMALQVHDELVFVVPDKDVDTARETILSEMIRPPAWAPDLPLAAETGVGPSYGDAKS